MRWTILMGIIMALTLYNDDVTSFTRKPKDYPLLSKIPNTEFSCEGRHAGYYADPEAGCQVYHMCDTLSKQYSYLCPNHTLFNQKFMICDHWYVVNCSNAESFYELNSGMHNNNNKSSQKKSKFTTNKTTNLKSKLPSKSVSTKNRPTTQSSQEKLRSFTKSSTPNVFTTTKSPTNKISLSRTFELPTRPHFFENRHKTSIKTTTSRTETTPSRSKTDKMPPPGFLARGTKLKLPLSFKSNSSKIISHDGLVFRPLPARKNPQRNSITDSQANNLALINQQLFNSIDFFKQSAKRKIFSSADGLQSLDSDSREAISSNEEIFHNLTPNKFMEPPTQPFEANIPTTLSTPFLEFKKVHKPVILQESFTPLKADRKGEIIFNNFPIVNDNGLSSGPHIVTPFGHRHFFIPPEEVSDSEMDKIMEEVSIKETSDREARHHDHEHHMTMVFPKGSSTRNLGRLAQEEDSLRLNPACPHCHPAFLKPGKCIPCVRIR